MSIQKKPILRTLSGNLFTDLESPIDPYMLSIYDIASGLSNVCRFSGQIRAFYSVAAHSLLVSEYIQENGGTPSEALCGLLHDASEAFLADLPSPVKRLCPDYQRIELRFMTAIAARYRIPFPFPPIVHEADQAVLIKEMDNLFSGHARRFPWANKNAKLAFLAKFRELGGYNENARKEIRRRKTAASPASKTSTRGRRKSARVRSKKV